MLHQEAFICQQFDEGELGFDPLAALRSELNAIYRAKLSEAISKIRVEVKREVLAQIPTIRSQVAKEVIQNIPEIRAQVRVEAKSAVKPWVIAAISVGALGLLAGGVAIYRGRKRL